MAIWSAVGLGGLVAWYAYGLPDVSKLETPSRRPSVTLLATDGKPFAKFGDLYGGPVALADLPPHLIQAVIATEDRRFYSHFGIDMIGVARAAIENIKAGAVRQGGSTITQQLAKNLFLNPRRTLRRKVQETLLALWLERKFSKDQILTIYLNRVYLGAGAYGVEAAAKRYFGKSVRAVSLLEAAVLAGLPKAPSRYAPSRDPAAAKRRASRVLASMVEEGYLSVAEAAAARARPLRVIGAGAKGSEGRYFADWVLERAASIAGRSARDIIITTTLDPRLQRIAQRRLSAMLKGPGRLAAVGQGALVALAPDGAVGAMVGGADYNKSQFNRATQALRQPGSAFKLFVYLAGLEAGLKPGDRLIDAPIAIGRWRPRNYDGRFRGRVSMGDALAYSINTVAVRVAERAGRRRVVAAARRLGITAPLDAGPSLALGAGEVRLIELTAAYGALANRGRAVWPHGIKEIRDASGRVLYRRAGSGPGNVIAPKHLDALNLMLAGVIARGTGRAARIERPAAGKTGTSQEFRDAWFIGYTAELITGVWLGNDDGSAMKRVTGGGLPARLWRDYMTAALKGLPPRPLPRARRVSDDADPAIEQSLRFPGDADGE